MSIPVFSPRLWWSSLRRRWDLKHLQAPEFSYLFDPPPDDEWVCIDCETTGLNVASDAIVSVAAVLVRGQRICTSQRLELVVQASRNVPGESIRIHQLRQADVAAGVPLEQAMRAFLGFIGSRPLVGYYLEFDVGMINRAIRPLLGVGLPNRQIEVSALYYTYNLRQLPPEQQHDLAGIDLRFDTLMADLDLPVRSAHNALNDAVMAALAFVKLRKLLAD